MAGGIGGSRTRAGARSGTGDHTYGRARRGGRGSVAFRRTVVVTLATLLVPGIGHLAMRRGRIGHPVLRTYLALVAIGVACVLLVPHEWWLQLAFKPWLLSVAEVLAVVVGVLWAAVVLHAFWISRPTRIEPPRRAIAFVIALVLAAVVITPFGIAARYAGVQRDLVSSLFPAGGSGPKGRMNILLLGSDAGADRTGTRTDTMVVVSVDLATGRSVLLSLPRNLEHAPMPDGPAEKRFPDGFNDLLKDTVGGILGIPVHYYLQVNLKGFQKMIDALGGVTVRVKQRLPIGGKGGVPITGYVKPGKRKLNGYQALWYARSRVSTDDYDRMSRQRCLLGAIAKQANPANVLARYQKLAVASKSMFRTDIPRGVMGKLVGVAKKAKSHRIESVSFVPPLIDPADPDWGLIKDKTHAAIDASMHQKKHHGKNKHGKASHHDRGGGGGGSSSSSSSRAQSVAKACG